MAFPKYRKCPKNIIIYNGFFFKKKKVCSRSFEPNKLIGLKINTKRSCTVAPKLSLEKLLQ